MDRPALDRGPVVGTGQPTLRETAQEQERERKTGIRQDPLVRAVLERFPGAEIVAIRDVNATTSSASDERRAPAR